MYFYNRSYKQYLSVVIVIKKIIILALMSFILISNSVSAQSWWNNSWKYREQVNISSHINRTLEPVDYFLNFKNSNNCLKDIRVTYDKNNAEQEIASTAWNISLDNASNCVSATITWLANITENKTSRFYIYYGNQNASEPFYQTDMIRNISTVPEAILQNSFMKITSKFSDYSGWKLNQSIHKEGHGAGGDIDDWIGENSDPIGMFAFVNPYNIIFSKNDCSLKENNVMTQVNCTKNNFQSILNFYAYSHFIKIYVFQPENGTKYNMNWYILHSAIDNGVADTAYYFDNQTKSQTYTTSQSIMTNVLVTEAWFSFANSNNGNNKNSTLGIIWNYSSDSDIIKLDRDHDHQSWDRLGWNIPYENILDKTSFIWKVGYYDESSNSSRYVKVQEDYKNPIIFSSILELAMNQSSLNISAHLLQLLQANETFTISIKITDNSNNIITNLSSSDIKLFRENQQINFTGFRNFNNGTYSLNASSGSVIGNISFRAEAGGASAEAFSSVMIKPKSNIAIIANGWKNIFSSGLVGKPVFTNYSETEKYYFGKVRPEQVFVFDNITTDYPTYRFKDKQAFLETFYSNETAITVSNREQALAAAPYARLKNIPILFDNNEVIIKKFNGIINLSEKSADEISGIAIKEFSRAWKNINTIIITNPYSETSELAGALAAKHNSIIIPMNFSAISYPETVSDFYSLNSANGVMQIRQKLNSTIKKLSDSFLFSNSIDYKIGRIQLNLILLGNVSEVPQPAVFDAGREMFFDYDSNYLLSDFPYADANGDGKADLITGRIVSPYQLIDLPKTNKIVTAALYRNLETVFSGNGLIESQATDTAFRTAGFETARLVENRTTLSYYELTFGFSNITDFLKSLFKEQSIMESLRLMDTIYSGYNELLEHNYYKMMNSLNLGWSGLTIKMVPDERLTKESLLGRMQNADGIFYYGKGGNDYWQLESFFGDKIHYADFPATGALIYGEHTNSARFPEKTVFDKGASAFVGSSGIIYDVYSFMPNAKFAQGIAGNKSIAASLEGSKYPLLPQQIKNLTASLKFNYEPRRDVAIKQFLQMVCYCDPEKKIDPDAQESGNNPAINQSATFKSRIRMPVSYIVSGNRLFFDAKDYLQEMGKPAIPIYSAETILPNGSRIIGIIFDYNSTKYENISADFVPIDEHFNDTAETVHEFYPSQMFYSETFDLLDGRKSVKMIAAGMQYNSGTKEALVLDGAEAAIEYSSPFEFVEFSAGNITSDKNQSFGINAAGENLSIVIDIRSGNFSETIEQKIPPGFSEINWAPPFRGEFSATAYILMENNSAGPRYAHFFVIPPAGFFGMFESFGANGYEKIMKSFSEKIRFAFNSAAAVIEYINPLEKFSSSANSSATKKQISSPDYSLSVAQDSGKIVYRMKDSRGELVLEKNAGATKETCKGDCSGLYAKINSGVSEMQSLQDYVVENIGK